ncbi:MAG: glutamate--tRNA ligase [Bradymonadaceae bacterium]
MSVRVRFAPSPTGYLHIGNTRTALFNYLFARHHDGDFLLRIEDTDRERSDEKYTEAIFEAHEWLGLEPDEEPVYQSNRTDLYEEKAQELLEAGDAYRDYSTEEEIEQAREEGFERGDKTAHTRLWRDRDAEPVDRDYVVRIKAPLEGSLTIEDHVQGEVTVEASELDDFIILRSDGSPTYNFCVVVDDADMDISHVVRGEDHLNNAFRQLYVYDALGYEPPSFAHLPMIEGLSKREGSKSVQDYRDDGYLPEALNNYLARLGWSHGDQELFSIDELIEYFDLDRVGRTASEFDHDKLNWINSEWMKRLDNETLAERWAPYLREAGFEVEVDDRLAAIAGTMHHRAETLSEMTDKSGYFFTDDLERNDEDVDEYLTPDREEIFASLIERFEALDRWDHDAIEEAMRGVCDEFDVGLGAVAQPTRVALTGGTVSPSVFETVEVMGRDKTLSRFRDALEIIRQRSE